MWLGKNKVYTNRVCFTQYDPRAQDKLSSSFLLTKSKPNLSVNILIEKSLGKCKPTDRFHQQWFSLSFVSSKNKTCFLWIFYMKLYIWFCQPKKKILIFKFYSENDIEVNILCDDLLAYFRLQRPSKKIDKMNVVC